MISPLMLILLLIWLIGGGIRIYKQARFYQIEEYMSDRYTRWLFSDITRWLPRRPIAAWFVGGALGLFLGEAPNSVIPEILAIIAAMIAAYPPDEGEIKRAFVRTQRVARMLAASFVIALLGLFLLIGLSNLLPQIDRLQVLITSGLGLIGFLLAPLWLMLGNLAMTPVEAFLRQQFINQAKSVLDDIQPKIIGITGSYGKTTTKNFLRDILNARYKTYATPKSYNTMMGVCIAINNDLAGDYSIEYFISEMGAYIPGEIARICGLTPPDISIVIEVGPQHLERFGSLENVAIAKYEIIKGLSHDGLGIFNYDNPYVREMYERGYPDNRIAVSREIDPNNVPTDGPRFIASNIENSLDGLRFTVTDVGTDHQEIFETPVIGEHNVLNILLATAVAIHEGMSLRDVALRVRTLQPAESRLVRKTTPQGITIINDAYSANPVGVISSLKVLGMHTTGKRLLITPGMVELGELHEAENRKLGEAATHYATDIILIGAKQTEPIKQGVLSTDFPAEHLHTMENLSEAVMWYEGNFSAGDTVLFLNDLPDTY